MAALLTSDTVMYLSISMGACLLDQGAIILMLSAMGYE